MTIVNKFIFLDIDGVMKPGRSYFCPEKSKDSNGGFDPLAVAAVNRICEKTGASVVFNTTWNQLNILDIAERQGITAPLHGKTKYPFAMGNRLLAIKDYLSQFPAEKWVALDDCEIDHLQAIRIDPDNGITCADYRATCRLLGNPDAFMLLL